MIYRCLNCQLPLTDKGEYLACENDHRVELVVQDGRKVPVFAAEQHNANEYNVEQAAQIHDNALAWVFKTFGGDEASLRRSLIARLRASANQKVLVTGVGAGNDLPFITEAFGNSGQIMALDFAKPMLLTALERSVSLYGLTDFNIEFCVADATELPFADDYFDCAYHFGGINLFSSVKRGISEMDRVVKNGGRVVFCDEGLAPWLKSTTLGKMLINNNPLYGFDAPLEHIPVSAREVNLSWCVADCFYVIDYTVADSMREIDLDVLHLGTRGGTIRKRYEGQLEGIDPQLKQALYQTAQQQGLSRVALLEQLLLKGLADVNDKT